MYFKLSLRNVKRSFKDYFVYFLTLTFAVCIFYSFNSLSDQQAMLDLSSSQASVMEMLGMLISGISVFISIVLAFLIIFANNFLIKRRKKELGLYMTLGMSKNNISRILVVETFFVGALSLVAGLLFGIFLSQGLSVLSASMFKVDISKYEFVFSSGAMMKTILYFGIIFFIVMLFNSMVISRYKLIDLLTAAKKNESLKIRKTSTSVMLFILSLLMLVTSYTVILKYGLLKSMSIVWLCVGLGALGTFLFFMSLSGFLLNMLMRNKNLYFKDVNMFVLRQINSKVNTTFVSMTIICLMLFFTIGVLSTGFSIQNSSSKNLDATTPFDATLYSFLDSHDQQVLNIEEEAKEAGFEINKYGEHHSFYKYSTDINFKKLLKPYQVSKTENFLAGDFGSTVKAIKKSDYEKISKMQGKEAVKLGGDEVLVIYNMEDFKETNESFVKNNQTITLNNKEYKISSAGAQNFSFMTDFMAIEMFTLVVPDEAANDMPTDTSILNINYNGNNEQYDEELYKKLEDVRMNSGKYDLFFLGATKTMVFDQSIGLSTTAVFIGIYLGIVFLISSAAVLALQQLSEASENMERYEILKKIGVTKKGINKAIFRQIFIYFMMPLSLAIVHSIIGIQVVNDVLMVLGEGSLLLSSFITGLVMIIVYGGYFLATYVGYKNIVK